MIFTSAQRYLTPKWQARVIPRSKNFRFNNGVTISNLWELKQALRIIREDIIAEHVNNDKNDIADWVEKVIDDKELAKELRKNTNRWGLIVALERQMMRTINLPHYVANRWLEKVELPFYFQDGKKAESLEELKSCLQNTSDEVIAFHLEREPNDIAKWVNDIIGDYQLAEILTESTNRQQMLIFVEDHMEMLKDAQNCK
ncbi:hypothetical protein GYA19_01550 [Candidatus Beckwithbacteria bacterium]|nr:hypothetical protein [Candidatus Beckwithbacteria bacterium]